MKRLINWAIGLPVAVVIVAISVANRQNVSFSLDPFSIETPFFAVELPLYLLLLGAGGIGLVFGGVTSWLAQGKWRRAAREARTESLRLRHEAEDLKRRMAQPPEALLPPAD